jgi:hypothetical protein
MLGLGKDNKMLIGDFHLLGCDGLCNLIQITDMPNGRTTSIFSEEGTDAECFSERS